MRSTVLLLCLAFCTPVAALAESARTTEPTTYRLNLTAEIRSAPDGEVVAVWDPETTFTSNRAGENWIRITGHFPAGSWKAVTRPLWVRKDRARTLKRPRTRPDGVDRYVVVHKKNFQLVVYEKGKRGDREVYRTRVALGIDGCLPEERGGRCYYTEPGEYKVRWKVYDPEGIEWCIPGYMEKEYPEAVARGERCFRGPIGTHALNIGKSYAIHGTERPDLLGRKVSHGCVRAENEAMATIYDLMDVGDPVLIRE